MSLPFNPPVPGMPTYIPFLYILSLTVTSSVSISISPSSSTALATPSATAPGSVHPKAGFTSSLRNSLMVNIDSPPIENQYQPYILQQDLLFDLVFNFGNII